MAITTASIKSEAKALEVHAATSNLSYEIDGLINSIDVLTQRLSPVMSDSNAGNADNANRPQSSVLLAATINTETDRVRDLTYRVGAILSRLEV